MADAREVAQHLLTVKASLQAAVAELDEYDPADLDHERLAELGEVVENDGAKLIVLAES